MTTETQTSSAASPLPVLTVAQSKAALAWIERDGASLRQVAAQLDLPADELLDILTQPDVAAFIEAADAIMQMRASILARYDDTDARQSLVSLAKNPEADHAIRLRAAITILQGPPPRRAAPPAPALPARPGTPTVPGGPGTPTVPGGPKPDRSTSNQPPAAPPGAPSAGNHRAPAQLDSRAEARSLPTPRSNTPARLNRAAGAPFARHDRAAVDDPGPIPPRASPATSGRPP